MGGGFGFGSYSGSRLTMPPYGGIVCSGSEQWGGHMPKTRVLIDIRKCIIEEEHDVGFTAGKCVDCSEIGQTAKYRYGLPHGHDKDLSVLTHRKTCVVGRRIKMDGRLK